MVILLGTSTKFVHEGQGTSWSFGKIIDQNLKSSQSSPREIRMQVITSIVPQRILARLTINRIASFKSKAAHLLKNCCMNVIKYSPVEVSTGYSYTSDDCYSTTTSVGTSNKVETV